MSEKRFTDIWCSETGHIGVTDYGIDKEFTSIEFEDFLNELNDENKELKKENMDLRAKHTQMIIIMKDVVKDLKRIDTYRYAEHLEKIANLHFLSEKELEDER